MKTITIRLPDVEEAMLVELQKKKKVFTDMQAMIVMLIRKEHEKFKRV